ncbi:DUF4810 domain-containing protein [Methylomarinum vadi]|uniref:DUF4810 domain-containing protein n=1 Tax=Methylomarinum vadi TaxID=438855 RepID=UPI00068A5F60|nr:DUF4810 domain-containing protein [Methylomarinum vadi]
MGIGKNSVGFASYLNKLLSLVALAFFLNGCAPSGIFYWGDYEDSLYQRYIEQNSAQAEVYLQETITDAERNHYRVPPGVYADYGFLLYRRGDKQAAIAFFNKEKRTYPESVMLMEKLIERVRLQMEQEILRENPSTDSGREP